MRYRRLGEINFSNSNGVSKKMYPSRTPEIYEDSVIQSKEKERELDDLAVDTWGRNAEIISYRLREQNVEKLLCRDFEEKGIITVMIPPKANNV